jgi:iron(III) transport system ATP-binding protein
MNDSPAEPRAADAALLAVSGVEQAYETRQVLKSVSFALRTGEIGCLLGASGCGKTTMLRCIAGFEHIRAGEIRLNGIVIADTHHSMPAEKRRIGMVFQDYALFPHLTVAANVGFGLHRMAEPQRAQRVAELLDTVGLARSGHRFPHELSGGQQQRVALARALAPRPQLLLLDEPFSNLDGGLRERLGAEVRAILKRQNTTAILVTHDQNEAFGMADTVGLMEAGRIAQWDSPYRLYHEPASRFVAEFVGQGTFLPGRIVGEREVEIELGRFPARLPQSWPAGTPVDVLLRPDDILHDDGSALKAEVVEKHFRGAEFLYTLRLPQGGTVVALVHSHHDHPVGGTIGIRPEIDHLIAFRRDAG